MDYSQILASQHLNRPQRSTSEDDFYAEMATPVPGLRQFKSIVKSLSLTTRTLAWPLLLRRSVRIS